MLATDRFAPLGLLIQLREQLAQRQREAGKHIAAVEGIRFG